MRGDAGGDRIALVDQNGSPVSRRQRQADQSVRAIGVFVDRVPFITKDTFYTAPDRHPPRQRECFARPADCQIQTARRSRFARHCHLARIIVGQCVFWDLLCFNRHIICINRDSEAHIVPCSRPLIRRIDVFVSTCWGIRILIGPSLFIVCQRAVGSAIGRDTGIPKSFPKRFSSAPKQQVYAWVTRCIEIAALIAQPIFFMPDRDEGFVIL